MKKHKIIDDLKEWIDIYRSRAAKCRDCPGTVQDSFKLGEAGAYDLVADELEYSIKAYELGEW